MVQDEFKDENQVEIHAKPKTLETEKKMTIEQLLNSGSNMLESVKSS